MSFPWLSSLFPPIAFLDDIKGDQLSFRRFAARHATDHQALTISTMP